MLEVDKVLYLPLTLLMSSCCINFGSSFTESQQETAEEAVTMHDNAQSPICTAESKLDGESDYQIIRWSRRSGDECKRSHSRSFWVVFNGHNRI